MQRRMSEPIISRRLGQRSPTTPPASISTRVGAVCAARTSPIVVAECFKVSSAKVSATGTTAEPRVEAVVAVKNKAKLRRPRSVRKLPRSEAAGFERVGRLVIVSIPAREAGVGRLAGAGQLDREALSRQGGTEVEMPKARPETGNRAASGSTVPPTAARDLRDVLR